MFRRKRTQQDFTAEIQAHLDLETDRLRREGLPDEEASALARQSFGNQAAAGERFYESRRWLLWDHLLQDLKYALRTLRHNPAFTVAAVLTLALGIGANTAIFSIIDTVLLKPLPYRDPDRLVTLAGRNDDGRTWSLSPADLLDYTRQARFFEHLAGYREWSFNLTGFDRPERIEGAVVAPEFLSIIGIPAQLGRTFIAGQDGNGGARSAVLGHSLWLRRYNSDPRIVGRTVQVDGEPLVVVGVMPPDFRFPGTSEIWVVSRFAVPEHVLSPDRDPSADRDHHYLDAIGRLRTGVTLTQARAEVEVIARRLKQQYKDDEEAVGAALTPLHEALVGDTRPALIMLLGAVALLLLIACANVANIVLARGLSRRKEITIRGALGAGRGRLISQLLTESAVLGFSGGALGLLLAKAGMRPLSALIPLDVLGSATVRLDVRVLIFTAAVSLAAALFFGLVPALHLSSPDLNTVLKEGGRGSSAGAGAMRARSVLVVSEIALAATLLIGAGLLIRSFTHLLAAPQGFRSGHVLTLRVSLPQARYPKPVNRAAFVRAVLDRAAALPGIDSASAISRLPLNPGASTRSITVQGRPDKPTDLAPDYLLVAPRYFTTMGIPLLTGRSFTDADVAAAPRVVIVSEATARYYWPHENPLGKMVRVGVCAANEKDWCQVVGVVRDVRQHELNHDPAPAVYVPYAQDPWPFLTFVVRTRMEPGSIASAAEAAIHAVDKDQPVYAVRTMDEVVTRSVSPARVRTILLGLFAFLALILACIGIYGIMAYAVVERRQEIGIRVALGADPGSVRLLLVKQGARLAVAGIGVGLVLSFGLSRYLATLLYGVAPGDPGTLAGIASLLLAVALLAAYIPARRATRVDPLLALRGD